VIQDMDDTRSKRSPPFEERANRDFGEKLLREKDFQEAFRIQVEHFQHN
jgi:hypothetical protein